MSRSSAGTTRRRPASGKSRSASRGPAGAKTGASIEPLRVLTAVPICDGHDSAISTINLEFIRHGIEVIYLGFHRRVGDMVRAAIQEDVRAIGISSYNGGHIEFFSEVVAGLKKAGAGHIGVFGGGGGTITPDDVRQMLRKGVDRIFGAGTSLSEIVEYTRQKYSRPVKVPAPRFPPRNDLEIARYLSLVAAGKVEAPAERRSRAKVIGVAGPGGAGKTTLLDELVLRFLRSHPSGRVAILSHDPSIVTEGALLGDRATMIYSQHPRVFMRSLATRGRSGGLAPQTEPMLRALRSMDFDLILVETVGIGQEAMPFTGKLVDRSVFVMSPEYGSQLQLQKIAMLDLAEIVVVNKNDLAGAPRAASEVEQRLAMNHRDQRVITTCAKKHRDKGVDELFVALMGPENSHS
jgi:methylmalonyl-CoA mutase